MKSRRSWLIGLALGAALSFGAPSVQAQPRLISYQGLMLDSKTLAPLGGQHIVEVKYYDASSAGTLLLDETHPSILFTLGVFNLTLGAPGLGFPPGMHFDMPYWMEVTLDPGSSIEQIFPRQEMLSAPYALNSERVGGLQVTSSPVNGALWPVPVDGTGKIDPSVLPVPTPGIMTLNAVGPDAGGGVSLLPGSGITLTPNASTHTITISGPNAGGIDTITAGPGITTYPGNGISTNVIVKIGDGQITNSMVGPGAITGSKISQIAGNGLIQDNGGLLDVNVDNSTLTISNNFVMIANGGIGTAQIANGSVNLNNPNSKVNGILPVANGGTGVANPAAGALLIGNGLSPITQLSDVAAGSVLASGGAGAAPVWSSGSGVFILNSTVQQSPANFNITGNGTVGTLTVNGNIAQNITGGFNGVQTIQNTTPGTYTYTWPDKSGTVAMLSDLPTSVGVSILNHTLRGNAAGGWVDAGNLQNDATNLTSTGNMSFTGSGSVLVTGTGSVSTLSGNISTATGALATGNNTAAGRVVFGDGASANLGNVTINPLAANRSYTLIDPGANANFILSTSPAGQTIGNGLTINGGETVNGGLNDNGTLTQTGALNLAGANSPLQVAGSAGTATNVLLSQGTGNTPIWSDGAANFILNQATPTQTPANFNISGNGLIGGTLGVTGATSLATGGGATTAGGTLSSVGATSLATGGGLTTTGGALTSANALTVSAGGAAITGNSSVSGTLGTTGATSLATGGGLTSTGGALTAASTLTVSAGGANLTGGLTLSGTGALTTAGSAGTPGWVLISNGGAAAPSWTNALTVTTMPFTNITTGTSNGQTLTVGTSSLTYSGGTVTAGVINANQLLGATWANPLDIGTGVAAAGTFTNLTSTAGLTVSAGGAAITGNSTVTGTFGASGATSLATGGGATTAGGTLSSVGATSLATGGGLTTTGGALTSAGALTVTTGGAAITGNSTVTGTFGTTGATSLATGGGATTAGGTLSSVGATSLATGGGLTSTGGALTSASTLTVSAGGANVTGGLTLSGTGALTTSGSAGTAGWVLISNGGAAAPSWTNALTVTTIPFDNVTSGTNANALLVSGSLAPTGAGTITANQFVGTGSTTNAVDLATGEVNGLLPVGNGGTGLNALAAGSILFGSAGNPMNTLGIGGNGTILLSTGTAPTWSSGAGNFIVNNFVSGTLQPSASFWIAGTGSIDNTTGTPALQLSNSGGSTNTGVSISVNGTGRVGASINANGGGTGVIVNNAGIGFSVPSNGGSPAIATAFSTILFPNGTQKGLSVNMSTGLSGDAGVNIDNVGAGTGVNIGTISSGGSGINITGVTAGVGLSVQGATGGGSNITSSVTGSGTGIKTTGDGSTSTSALTVFNGSVNALGVNQFAATVATSTLTGYPAGPVTISNGLCTTTSTIILTQTHASGNLNAIGVLSIESTGSGSFVVSTTAADFTGANSISYIIINH